MKYNRYLQRFFFELMMAGKLKVARGKGKGSVVFNYIILLLLYSIFIISRSE